MTGYKSYLLSKTVWAALITGLIGTYLQVDIAVADALPDIPPVVLTVLAALGIYGRAVATERLGN
jgi:hypothetical protein